jgi:hypothetical protein
MDCQYNFEANSISESIKDATYLTTANYAFVLIVAKAALVTDADKSCGADVRVADRTLAVTLVAETTDSYARLLAAHNKIAT